MSKAHYFADQHSAETAAVQVESFSFSPQTAADLIVWLNQPPSVSPLPTAPHSNLLTGIFLRVACFASTEEIREGRGEYVKRQRITAVPDDKLRQTFNKRQKWNRKLAG